MNMTKTHLQQQSVKIAKSSGFDLGKEIYRGNYYSPNRIRNIMFDGRYKNKAAILKIYNDAWLSDEPISQITFNQVNTSKLLIAPEVYKYKIESARQGWLIMEKLPKEGAFFTQPIKNKQEFADLYLEYRLNFPQQPTRNLTLAENLRADEFHIFRISRWLELATVQEAEKALAGEKVLLNPKEFIPKFEKGLNIIHKEFSQRQMIWCHGHFKPHELFKMPNENLCYLTDFAHSKMYPEGYEFGFIIWADWLMSADWNLSYKKWKTGVDEWLKQLRPVAEKLKIKNFDNLIIASIIERVIGSILADICAGERPRIEKEKRIKLLYPLLDDIFRDNQ